MLEKIYKKAIDDVDDIITNFKKHIYVFTAKGFKSLNEMDMTSEVFKSLLDTRDLFPDIIFAFCDGDDLKNLKIKTYEFLKSGLVFKYKNGKEVFVTPSDEHLLLGFLYNYSNKFIEKYPLFSLFDLEKVKNDLIKMICGGGDE